MQKTNFPAAQIDADTKTLINHMESLDELRLYQFLRLSVFLADFFRTRRRPINVEADRESLCAAARKLAEALPEMTDSQLAYFVGIAADVADITLTCGSNGNG